MSIVHQTATGMSIVPSNAESTINQPWPGAGGVVGCKSVMIWAGRDSSESRPRPLPCLLGLDLAVARRRIGLKRRQQAPRGIGDFGNGAVERFGIGLRRRIEPGKLAHELQRRGMDFSWRRRRFEIEQRLDITAHGMSPAVSGRHANRCPEDDRPMQNPTSWSILP